MSLEDAFLHEILAHPEDDAPRLIYADWLEERNDPRGEFIRVQCVLAQLGDEDPRRWPLEQREQELLREHQTKWLPKDIGADACVLRRGFVEEIALSPEDFLSHADRLCEQEPILRLRLQGRAWGIRRRDTDPLLRQVASWGHLARIRKLTLVGLSLSRLELRELLGTPLLRHLREIQLSRLSVETEGPRDFPAATLPVETLQDLTELPCHDELTALHLADTALSLQALRLLATTTSLPSLTQLNLNGNRLTHQAATILGQGPLLAQLESLHLESNFLGDAGALTIRNWPSLPRLTRLSLGHNQIFAAGVQALAEAPALRELLSLNLFGNISCDGGTASLASSSQLSHLRALNLRFNGVSDDGVRALAHSETLRQLTHLNLTANRITSAGVRALSASPMLSQLARLELLRNDIAATEQEELRQRFGPFVTCWPIRG